MRISFVAVEYPDDLVLAVRGLDVNTVEFVAFALLVALALKEFHNLNFFLEKHGEEPLEDLEVGLVAQDVLCGPVESDKAVVGVHKKSFFTPQRYVIF